MKKMPFFMKLDKMMGDEMDEDGYYIHTLSVSPQYQGRGIGAAIIETLAKKYGKLYAHVNSNRKRAVKFYKRMGFIEKSKGTLEYKGNELSESLMERLV